MIETFFAFSIKASEVGIPQVAADTNTFNNIVGLVYAIIGALALFFIVRAGLLFVTSGSDPSSVRSARETVLYSVIALGASTLVFAIVKLIIEAVG